MRRQLDQLAAILGDLERSAKQRLRRRRAEAHDHPRLHHLDLSGQPRPARRDLARVRLVVDAPLALRDPLEVLHHVGHVAERAIDARFRQRLVEQAPGRPDERLARQIFLVARLLADEHDLGLLRPRAEDRLRAAFVQIAAAAIFGRVAQLRQAQLIGKKIRRRPLLVRFSPGHDHDLGRTPRCARLAPLMRTDALIAELRGRYPGRVSTTPPDRVAYARDLWPRGLLGVAAGDPAPHPPDAVVWPTSTAEVSDIVQAAQRAGTPIVPFGAGSGVCGGTLPIRGGLLIDLKRMRRLVELDERAAAATFEAGILGEHLEHELNRRGWTMGHFPSSIMCSTYGGWLAARSAGQFSTKYGKIEDMVRRLTFVDGRGGTHELEAGGSPDLAQLIVGSEGTLGIITQATCTVHPLPATRIYRGWAFPRVAAGCEAIRRLLQRNLRPAAVRLYDELDSFLHRSERDKGDGHRSAREATEPVEGSALGDWLAMLAPSGKGLIAEWKKRAVNLALTRP